MSECEICGRGYTEEEGHLTGERGPAACVRLGYERERRRAESAERELESCRSRLSTAEKALQDFRWIFAEGERLEKAFWSKMQTADGCWPWTGATDPKGYGQLSFATKKLRAARVAWMLHHGKPFPHGMDACHSCDNPGCVNPAHIWSGTRSENMLDAVSKGRLTPPAELGAKTFHGTKTHCVRGHPFAGANVRLRNDGTGRVCRECERVRVAEKRAVYERREGGK